MANNQSISEFIEGFNGGSRINRFKVVGELKEAGRNDITNFHIRAASLPSSQVGAININYRGRTVSFPGDRMYQPWTITVLDDRPATGNSKSLYAAFHDWQNEMNDHVDNTALAAAVTDPSYHFATDWRVQQLDTNGSKVIREFILKNCWPVYVGPVELDMSQDNTLATFAVTLVYSHFDYVPANLI